MTDTTNPAAPVCVVCGRSRTLMDAYDYNPLQVVTGQPLGWYSGDDGEFLSLLLLLFIGLKLAGVITWSWWWVLAPFWVPLALVLIIVGATFAYLRWVAKA